MLGIYRIGGAVLDSNGDEGQTEEEVSIRLTDGLKRVRMTMRCMQYNTAADGTKSEKMTEQCKMSFQLAHLPLVIAALQAIQADEERAVKKTRP